MTTTPGGFDVFISNEARDDVDQLPPAHAVDFAVALQYLLDDPTPANRFVSAPAGASSYTIPIWIMSFRRVRITYYFVNPSVVEIVLVTPRSDPGERRVG